jgi:diguanylate cyclase (GGDEF)-like protein/PAS domain S-box-containing protein
VIETNWDDKSGPLSERQLKFAHAAINKSQSPFFWINPEGRVVDLNDCACHSLGYTREELIGQYIWFFDPDFIVESWPIHWVELEKKLTMTFESRHQRKDNSSFPVEITTNYIIVDGEIYCFSFSQDLTERKQTEVYFRVAATAFEAQEAMVITDAESIILQVNRAFTDSTGFTEQELVGRNINMLRTNCHDEALFVEIQESIEQTGAWQREIWGQRKSGEIYPKWLTITAVKGDNDMLTHYVSTHADITERKLAEEEIKHLAFYDPLTDLPNRRLLLERLKYCIDVDRREGKQLALLMVDLDYDNLGHLAGDELLQQVSGRIKCRLRDIDMVARLGGDEFVVLLDNISHLEDAARVAKEIVAELGRAFSLSMCDDVRIGSSIGISLYPQHGDTPEALVERADTALYHAKSQGGSCFAYFSSDMTIAVRERMELEARLRRAILQQELRVFYQPQLEMATGRIVGAEALVRWQDLVEGLILPARFIPLAEETKLIVELSEWVLRETCRQGRLWLDRGVPPVTLAVNISPYQFLRSDIASLVALVLEETGFPASLLVLEITERALMQNQEQTTVILNNLHVQGVRIAIDDFGTGYSSLFYLKRLPIEALKIDKSFIAEIPNSVDNMDIAATVVAMAHSLGCKVLAEGVETTEQLAFLQAKGCDLYQGFIKNPPMLAEEFAALLTIQ